uniref:Uncharacterized protein n=1 Tax=Fagus sylvatica TaxID=28930 RepID=A0A2N9HHZ3_FAGSY
MGIRDSEALCGGRSCNRGRRRDLWIASRRLGFFPRQWVTELWFFLSDA